MFSEKPFPLVIADVMAMTTDPLVSGLVRLILREMQSRQAASVDVRDTYQVYTPGINYAGDRNPNRKRLGQALACIWSYCFANEIPPVSYLLVGAGTDLPTEGVMNWYVEKFGTAAHYAEFCNLQCELARLMINNRLIVIV